MNPEALPGINLSTYERETKTATVCSPRVIIISLSGEFVLVRYKDTAWLGLPGGKVQIEEYQKNGNLLSAAAFPTLEREVSEECGLNISPYLAQFFNLGLAEVVAVDSVQRVTTNILTPISVCPISRISKNDLRPGTVVVNIEDHLPGPLFPDARSAIAYFKRLWQAEKPIHALPPLPVYLSPKKLIFFQMRPIVGPLWGPPDWYR